jgi:hypothetical protein
MDDCPDARVVPSEFVKAVDRLFRDTVKLGLALRRARAVDSEVA